MQRLIVHVDMDAFFAAIEQRDDPRLSGKPVVVGADPKGGKGRGVVSTCSYEARKFGIHSAMPISTAYRKCPHAVFVQPDMEKYSMASRQIYAILYDFTPDIEPIGIDEAFMDISTSCHLFGAPVETCMLIKSRIKSSTGLTASVGLAPTKMAAKIASDLKKPDGMVEVKEDGLRDFLGPLDVGRLWGLGEKSRAALNEIGIRTIGDLARRDVRELVNLFGKNGQDFWELANGIDDREIVTGREAKSISNETTFPEDTSDNKAIESALMSLCEEVSHRLREEGLKARTVTLKIRTHDFSTYTRATTRAEATNHVDPIYQSVRAMCNNFDREGRRVRLVGVRASNFHSADFKDTLFCAQDDEKKESIHRAVDAIKEKFGYRAIHRAAGL